MEYSITPGSQGICLDGWHVPSDDELKYLEGTADSLYGVGDSLWDNFDWRGSDVAVNLKSTSRWYSDGNGLDLFGFNALPAGYYNGNFVYVTGEAHFWSSNENGSASAIWRYLSWARNDINRHSNTKAWALSLRCIMD